MYHIELVAVPVTPLGPDLAALEALCAKRHIRAVYTMPTLHNPLGWVLTMRQRGALVTLARRFDLLLIEDAPYAWLVKPAPQPLAMLAPERTVYVTGFSKNIATGLRVGAVVCPPRFLGAFERTIRATTWNTPAMMATLVCNWLRDGTVARFEALKRRDARAPSAHRPGGAEPAAGGEPTVLLFPLAAAGGRRAGRAGGAKIAAKENFRLHRRAFQHLAAYSARHTARARFTSSGHAAPGAGNDPGNDAL